MYIFILVILFASISHAASPSDLLKQHILKVGGKDRLEHLGSVERVGTIFFPDYGQPLPKGTGSYRTRIMYPDRVRIEIHVGAYQMDQIKSKDQYWDLDGQSYKAITDLSLKDELASTSLRANREILWWSEEHKNIRLKTQLPRGITEANCIEGDKSVTTEFACFDSNTGLLKAYGTDQEFRAYSDWKSVSHLKFPFKIRQYKNGTLSYAIDLKSVVVNTLTDQTVFSPPR